MARDTKSAKYHTVPDFLAETIFWENYAKRYHLKFIGYQANDYVQLALYETSAIMLFRALFSFFYLRDAKGVDYHLHDVFNGHGGRFIVVRKTGLEPIKYPEDSISVELENSVKTWYRFAQQFELLPEEVALQTTKYFHLTPATTADQLFDALYLLERISRAWKIDFELIHNEGKQTIMVV